MKRLLSVLLALMMVVSTVSFAAPSAVTVADVATDAAVYETAQKTAEEVAELAADSEYGTLVFNIDFEKDGISFAKNTAVDVNTITDNYNADICPAKITFNPRDFADEPQLVTDANGNTYLNCTNSAAASGYRFFQINEGSSVFDWKDGTFTMVIDYYYTGGLNSIAFHVNGGNASPTMIQPIQYSNNTWQTVVAQYSGQIQSFYIAPGYAANYTNSFGVDNIRLYYSAESVKLTIKADNATQATADGVVSVSTSTGMTVSNIVANAGMADLIGLAETKNGAMLSASTLIKPVYAKNYYGVFGCDVNVQNNGNSAVSNVTVNDVDTRTGITVAELIAKINNTSDVVLRGLSETPDGEPMEESTIINVNKTLYMIWEADESEYGTLLANIDFENFNAGTRLEDYQIIEVFDTDAITNGEFQVIWETGNDTIAEENGNKYIRGGQKYAQVRFKVQSYNTYYSPMPEGTYTVVLDAKNFAGTSRSMSATNQGAGASATLVDSFVGTPGTWDKVVGQWNGAAADMTMYFTDSAETDVGFDNIKLYYQPAEGAKVTYKIDPNDNNTAVAQYVSIDAGESQSVGGILGAMTNNYTGCLGVAETADGEIITGYVLPKYNTTVYAVWGFDVTLDAGFNTEMSNVVVSDIDTRFGMTIGELISKINNTTDKTLRGLSKTPDGEPLDVNTVIKKDTSILYMIWELDEEELGTLVFNIDFEKDGITTPDTSEYVNIYDITDVYNETLVVDDVLFGARFGAANEIVTSGANTYLVSTGKTGGGYINLYINEASNKLDWLNGTYTMMVDAMVLDTKANSFTSHVNDSSTGVTCVDGFSNEIGIWDTVTYSFEGKISRSDKHHYYIAFNMPEGKKIAFDNYKLYFKTDETIITLKANGNSDISDIEVPVSTATGITVGELIEAAKAYPTTHKLLGIAETGTGEPMDEDTVIKPAYQQSYYLIWSTSANDQTISTQYGKLLFNVDFERESLLESGWDGHLSIDDTRYTAGSHPNDIASYFDEGEFVKENGASRNFRIKFLTTNGATNASIKTDASGNHYLSGTAESQWPQIAISNNDKLVFGAGYYTVFFDGYVSTSASLGINTPAGATIVAGGNSTNTALVAPKGEWQSYEFKFELSEGTVFPNVLVNYSLNAADKGSAIVGWDDFKVYYKPYTATVTIEPGDYTEFGISTFTGIDTTTATTLDTVIDSIKYDIAVSGREFVGLMDKYGEMVDLEESVIIPCDMTYTIVWNEESVNVPVTRQQSSIRYSTKVNSRGVRFGADTTAELVYDESTTEYGWVIARTDVLEAAGIKATSLTKESFGGASNKVIVGKNYDSSVDADERKHCFEDGSDVMITAVIYGVPEKYYRYEFTVRPYIVIDGKTYYGKPFSRSIYDTAVAVRDAGYVGCDGDTDLINYIDTIIANTPAE